jgi:GT2 family glycosyltransferase
VTTSASIETGRSSEIGAVGSRPAVGVRASVIVVSYNGRGDLHRCLQSVFGEPDPDVELIVVDNGSSDGSADHVANTFPAVRVIRNAINSGFGAGCNLGAGFAQGVYLAFLNPDTVVEPGWLDELIRALDVTPDAALATSQVVLRDAPDQINAAGNDTHFTGLTLCRGAGQPRRRFEERADVGAVSGAAFVARRSVFAALGGFDESFFLYMEDADLSWRARLAGYRCLYVPSSVVYHRYALRFSPSKTFYQERNRYRMLLKTLRWRTILVLAPGLLLAECVTWGFVLLGDLRHLTNKLRAYCWIATHWREIQEARRRTQARRRRSDRELIASCGASIDFRQVRLGIVTTVAERLVNPVFRTLHRIAVARIDW